MRFWGGSEGAVEAPSDGLAPALPAPCGSGGGSGGGVEGPFGGRAPGLAARFWDDAVRVTGRALSRLVQFLLVTVSLLAVAALAFATVAVRYPFQYDHLLNAQGGWLRRVQEVLTSRANPDVLEAAMWALIGLLALPTIVRAALRRPLPAAALLIPALAVAGSHSSPSTAGVNAGPNVVLIL